MISLFYLEPRFKVTPKTPYLGYGKTERKSAKC
jgi:hypothetical protein